MNRMNVGKKWIPACAAIVSSAGLAASAVAADRSWTGGGAWSSAASWWPVGVPVAGDDVGVGNVAGVQNSSVYLNLNANVHNLFITDGMTLDTNLHRLAVGLQIDVSGRNVVGSNAFPSRLVVDEVVAGAEVTAELLTVRDQGEVVLNGAGVSLDSYMNIGEGSVLRGEGVVWFLSNFATSLANNGTITPTGALSFHQNGTGRYDLDGSTGGGDLDLTAASDATLTFNGDGISEPFGGTLSMIKGTRLQMNLDDAWAVEDYGTVNIYGSGTGTGPARIAGSPVTMNGTFNLYGGSLFELASDVTFSASSELVTGLNATADVSGDATINGGLFTVNEGSNLDFDGATVVHGGEFVTHSNVSTTGSIDFNGATEWDGNISIAGFARQNGPAHVTGPTIITGDTFDMDGSDDANWDVDANLTLNVDRIDYGGNSFNTTMDIGAGRLNVNLMDPDAWWFLAGTTNLSGNSILFSTKIGDGSELHVTGTINVVGKCDILTETGVAGSATINIPAANAALRFMSDVFIDSGVTFSGGGTIQNGANSIMTFHTGLNTNGVGVHNAGTLRVGSTPGIMSVDRFTTTGIWDLDIGGYVAGAQHDRVVSNGPATIGGTLEVDLTNGFQPAIGDEFTILTAVGGITGSFAPGVTTSAGSFTYHWDVLIDATDVTLRLASIESDCPADLDDGSGTGTPDGGVTIEDLLYFIAEFGEGGINADLDDGSGTGTPDEGVTIDDLLYFLDRFSGGC